MHFTFELQGGVGSNWSFFSANTLQSGRCMEQGPQCHHAVLHFNCALWGKYFYIGALLLNTVCKGYGIEPNTPCSLSFHVIILIPVLLT